MKPKQQQKMPADESDMKIQTIFLIVVINFHPTSELIINTKKKIEFSSHSIESI